MNQEIDRGLARICLDSATRARELARTASDSKSRAYWEASANEWAALFWATATHAETSQA